jgi:hypothetical protein
METILAPMEEDTHCIAFKSMFTEMRIVMQEVLDFANPKVNDLTDDIIWQFGIMTIRKNMIGLLG